MAEMQKHALNILQNMFIHESEYFFVIDKYGNNIMNGQDLFPKNTNILSLKDMDGKELVKELIKSSESMKPYFVSYKLRNPVINKIEQKFSYVKKVEGSDWIVGSGFYYNEYNQKLEEKTLVLQAMYKKQYKTILAVSFLLIILSIFVSYFLSMALKKRFTLYSKAIKDKNNEKIGHLTISAGLVTYKADEDKDELIKRVDLALYNAKNNGRNTIILGDD